MKHSARTWHSRPLLLAAPLLLGGGLAALLVTSAPPPAGPAPARAQAADPDVLLLNGDFSQNTQGQPNHWVLRPGEGTTADSSLDEQAARSTPYALRLTVAPEASVAGGATGGAGAGVTGRAALMQPLARVPGKAIVVAGWSKTRDLTGTARAIVRSFDSDGQEINTVAIALEPSLSWSPFSRSLTVPRGAARVLCSFEVNGQGTLWLDDVSAAPAPSPNLQR